MNFNNMSLLFPLSIFASNSYHLKFKSYFCTGFLRINFSVYKYLICLAVCSQLVYVNKLYWVLHLGTYTSVTALFFTLFMFINDSLLLLNSLRGSFKLIKQMAGVRPLTEEEKELMSLYGKPITVYDILQAFSQDKVCIIFLYFFL